MGALSFRLPGGLTAGLARDLERSCVAGGYDFMPAYSKATVSGGSLIVSRDSDESAALIAPFEVPGAGKLLGATATLVQRAEPYSLITELARGKINQLRCQSHDWSSSGMTLSDELTQQIHDVTHRFSKAVAMTDAAAADIEAIGALTDCYAAAHQLVIQYMNQLLQLRISRQGQLESLLGVRINGATVAKSAGDAFNSFVIPMSWRQVEPTESHYTWDATDAALTWAESQTSAISAGPLIEFSTRGLPDWLWLWQGDLQSLASFMCDYVETAVGRYRGRIRRWCVSGGANIAGVLKLGEEDLLWLTARLAETAWQVDPDLELVISISQPWGGYLARKEYTYTPFIFADTLIRAGLKLAALELEWFMGMTQRGSYCRDGLEASRQLDLYAMLGIPLQVALAYPAGDVADQLADPEIQVGNGHWRTGYTPQLQAQWAATFAKLAISKPFVRGITWCHLHDSDEHTLPNCGIIDATGAIRPVLAELQNIKVDLK